MIFILNLIVYENAILINAYLWNRRLKALSTIYYSVIVFFLNRSTFFSTYDVVVFTLVRGVAVICGHIKDVRQNVAETN